MEAAQMNITETMVRTRIDPVTKKEAELVLNSMGLSMSAFLRMALIRVAKEQALPFEVKVPNATTKRAMKEATALIEARKVRFKDAGELLNDLEKNS